MQLQADGWWRRGAMVGLVLLAHALLLWLLLQVRASLPGAAALERLSLLYLPAPERPVPKDAQERPAPSPTRRRSRRPSAEAPAPATRAAPGTSPPNPGQLPPIDWTKEQQQAAESEGREIWKDLSKHCRDAQALHIYPPECHRYVAPEPWEPEDKRFGLAGPLPYVRLGRCVVGLGFWGCAVGKPPAPNGRVFDGMRDPDRPGVLPDNGGYQAAPEPRERLH